LSAGFLAPENVNNFAAGQVTIIHDSGMAMI